MNILKLNLKKVINSNFIFMSFVALGFGLLPILTNDNSTKPALYPSASIAIKGYVFLFIVFANELSKSLLQMEKISKKVEWLLANGVGVKKIVGINSLSLYLSTNILLLPLIVVSIIFLKEISLSNIIDYYIYTLVCSIIINMEFMYIKNMNRFRTVTLWVSLFYLISFILEMIMIKNLIMCGLKYVIALVIIVLLYKFTTKERITSAYY